MMDLLGIKSIRPGADPRNPQAPNAVNYDEAKADPRLDAARPARAEERQEGRGREDVVGASVARRSSRTSIARCTAACRKNVPKVEWRVASTTAEKVGGIPVTTKALVGRVDNSAFPAINVDIEMTLTTPADGHGPGAGDHRVRVPLSCRAWRGRRARQAPRPRARPGRSSSSRRAGATRCCCPTPSRPTTARDSRRASSASRTRASRASSTTGARCARGPGARAARSTTWRPTRPSTRSASASKASRATARPRS